MTSSLVNSSAPSTLRLVTPSSNPTVHTTIWVKHSFVGFHQWPDAPADVSYLRNLHRHLFNVKVSTRVDHTNRAVEFHQFKHIVTKAVEALTLHLQTATSMSCEMMAEYLNYQISMLSSYTAYAIEVDEDGECGAASVFIR